MRLASLSHHDPSRWCESHGLTEPSVIVQPPHFPLDDIAVVLTTVSTRKFLGGGSQATGTRPKERGISRASSERLQQKVVEGLQQRVVEEHDHEGLWDSSGALLHHVNDVGKVPVERRVKDQRCTYRLPTAISSRERSP